jgi:hypothetical protein
MSGEYERAFGKFPREQGPLHMWRSMAKWQSELRSERFDADDFVWLGQVESSSGTGHGGVRWGRDGWSWIIGLGKVFGRKVDVIEWSDLDYLELRRDPFSVAFGDPDKWVKFVAVTDADDFVRGEMADVLVSPFTDLLQGGQWKEASQFPAPGGGPFEGTVEGMWSRAR